jgi:hypothetical protein
MDGLLTYRQATLRAALWVAVAALLAVGAAFVRPRFDPENAGIETFKMVVLAAFAALPLVAGAAHRSVRVVTLTALFEALLLGGLLGATTVNWRGWF